MSKLSLRDLRRLIHSHPELARQERGTTALVSNELTDLGLEPTRLAAGTGLYCDIAGNHDAPIIALRADLDALPVQDEKDVPYKSTHPGVSHACGHDVHTTMLLGAVRLLVAKRAEFSGNVRLIFQPAEEATVSGSLDVLAAGALDGVSAIFAMHCDPSRLIGDIGLKDGEITSANDEMAVRLFGLGGHSARPHLVTNPIDLIGRIVVELPSYVASRLGSGMKALVGFGSIHAGEASNAIPSYAEAGGTVRIADPSVWPNFPGIIEDGLAKILAGEDIRWEIEYNRVCPIVVNDPKATSCFRKAAENLFGPESVSGAHQSYGGEDFAWYLQAVPGSLARIGVRSAHASFQTDLHSGLFDVDERVLEVGSALLAEVAVTAMQYYGKK